MKIDQSILNAVSQVLNQDAQKDWAEFIKKLELVDLKNKKSLKDMVTDMIYYDYYYDYLKDSAHDAYDTYNFYWFDDSDYDREYGYGRSIELRYDTDSEPDDKVIEEATNDILKFVISDLKDYDKTEKLAKFIEDNYKVIFDALNDRIYEFYKDDYIDEYIEYRAELQDY